MRAMFKLILLFIAVVIALWASTAFAQKDRMHMGEALNGRVIRPTGEATTKPADPDPLHSQPAATRAEGELKPQRVPTFNDQNREIQGK